MPRGGAVRRAFHEELHPARQSALISWGALTAAFAAVRVVTWSIRDGKRPLRNLTPGGLHLHHYMWGVATVTAVGGVSLHGADRLHRHPVVATSSGAGLALIVDEFALLLDSEDVYWARQARVSVDVAVGLMPTAGIELVGLPALRRLRRDHHLTPATTATV